MTRVWPRAGFGSRIVTGVKPRTWSGSKILTRFTATLEKKISKLDSNFVLGFEDAKHLKFGYKKCSREETVLEFFFLLVKILSVPADSSE